MKLSGIEKALRDGCTLHGFQAGLCIRVARIEKKDKLVGYGEGPFYDDALIEASKDYLARGKLFYRASKPEYLTGAVKSCSRIDDWILATNTMVAWNEQDDFVVELRCFGSPNIPEDIKEQVERTGQSATWQDNGYTYKAYQTKYWNGELDVVADMIRTPRGDNPWPYTVVRLGRAGSLEEAMEKALDAEPLGVPWP